MTETVAPYATDEHLLSTLHLMAEAFDENPKEFGGLAKDMSVVCKQVQHRLRELLGVPATSGILH